jgi:hypothetical protein
VGSIPSEVIGFLNRPTPHSDPGVSQPLTEMSIMNLLGVKGGQHLRLTSSLPSV